MEYCLPRQHLSLFAKKPLIYIFHDPFQLFPLLSHGTHALHKHVAHYYFMVQGLLGLHPGQAIALLELSFP